MKIEIETDEDGSIVLKKVYSGIYLETAEGNRIGICMRDDTFEINVIPKEDMGNDGVRHWHRVDMQKRTIEKDVPVMVDSGNDNGEIN